MQAGGAAAGNSDAHDRNSLQLHLQDLNLDNVDALEGLKLNIQVWLKCTAFCAVQKPAWFNVSMHR